jgi:pectin methylesterase-like acyl-CoA thioesterase
MFRRILSGLGLICLASLLLVLPAAGSGGGSDEVNPSGIVVDDPTTPTCPGIDYTSIQAAVTASPAGSTIQVCPGVYNEQVVIDKRITLKGVAHANEDAPIVKPIGAVANSTSLASGRPIAAIILARAARNITAATPT